MILRLDDTDVERNTQASVDSIFDGLNWLNLGWDEFYKQSERIDLHTRMAWQIFEAGMAYRDFTPADANTEDRSAEAGSWLFNSGMRELSRDESDARSAAGESFVLRFRVPRGIGRTVRFKDSVYGEQAKEANDIEDFALLRSNGFPTYHMASCADDVDINISHIIRGQDHLSNTFKHILIFEALGTKPPRFAHLPLLIAPDGSKLSKRKHGPVVSVTTYRDAGFLPHAYVNFLCLLGWSPKNNREQMTRQEIMEAFSFEGINRSNAVVNFSDADPIDPKALWLNGQHLRIMPVEELVPIVRQELEQAGLQPVDEATFPPVVDVIRSRYTTLHDFVTKGRPYFADDFPMEPAAAVRLEEPNAREYLRELGARLETTEEFSEAHIEKTLRDLAAEKNVKAGILINGSRAILTGQSVGPSAFHVFTAIGRNQAIQRLKSA